ncbi:hypothetical protein [Nocardioides sp.]|uniref:hypothetical protein n=1 Tax=Nocardioides sp. TaxID=35761 RepID=UPI0035178991
MSDQGAPGDGRQRRTPEEQAAWERRRRRAEVFGESLPETTSDEREPDPRDRRDGDTWLKEQVPPHHGS